ncbi:MAG TPA: YdcF family protein [Verrucomicrobiae bacterium]|nr:YdcF family protein [Verrucomicrobiae bacterium]
MTDKSNKNRILGVGLGLLGVLNILNCILLIGQVRAVSSGIILQFTVALVLLVLGHYRFRGRALLPSGRLRVLIKGLCLVFTISFLIVEGLIFHSALARAPVQKPDYLVILGSGIKRDQISPQLRERLLAGEQFAKEHDNLKIIVSGGQGPGESIPEAEAMYRFLVSGGIAADHIIREERSTSTFENFKNTRELLNTLDGREKLNLVIVSSDYHLLRAKFLARRVGFEPQGMAAKTPWLDIVNCYLREYLAVIKSFVKDRL